MKTLLQQVLVAHEQVEAFRTSMSDIKIQRSSISKRSSIVPPVNERLSTVSNLGNELTFSCRSAGFFAGNFAEISILRDGVTVSIPFITGRGLNMLALDPFDGQIVAAFNFDTHFSKNESEGFVRQIKRLPDGSLVAIVGKDDFFENMIESAYVAIESLGAKLIRQVRYRDSYCLIGQKGNPDFIMESHSPANNGPTPYITKAYELNQPHGLLSKKGHIVSSILPSNGWWIRRRRNDGALNRVPPNFYPKIWHLLSKTAYIRCGSATLNSVPTISESTPEELNFGILSFNEAFQVENLLNNIIDPAEHQIAVECLVVIKRMEERNPELTLTSNGFDLQELISETIHKFWAEWINEQISPESNSPVSQDPVLLQKVIDSAVLSPVTNNQPIINQTDVDVQSVVGEAPSALHHKLDSTTPCKEDIQGPGLSFAKNEKLARRIFFDVKQNGLKGTMAYLAATCVHRVFKVSYRNSDE
jgi:hypothetical protein